jgi:N6-adenosine-specific RNA methylase IME4
MKCKWSKDTQGFYLLPLIGYSKTPTEGRTVWFGIGRWLWKWYV